ncbi:MAG: hypothetical protein JNK05_00920 [Myxococcales bacterium]|nr:hypothetical protein [Myxococcales bacterium]
MRARLRNEGAEDEPIVKSSSTGSLRASLAGTTVNDPKSAVPSADRTAGRASENESLGPEAIEPSVAIEPARRTRAVSCSVAPG